MDWAWEWVRSLWDAADEGWHIDPDGLDASGPGDTPRETSDNGMCIDPDG